MVDECGNLCKRHIYVKGLTEDIVIYFKLIFF